MIDLIISNSSSVMPNFLDTYSEYCGFICGTTYFITVIAFHTADFILGCRPSRANISCRKSASDISAYASSHVSPIGITVRPVR